MENLGREKPRHDFQVKRKGTEILFMCFELQDPKMAKNSIVCSFIQQQSSEQHLYARNCSRPRIYQLKKQNPVEILAVTKASYTINNRQNEQEVIVLGDKGLGKKSSKGQEQGARGCSSRVKASCYVRFLLVLLILSVCVALQEVRQWPCHLRAALVSFGLALCLNAVLQE